MGYLTDYYGTIKLSEKGVKLLSEKYIGEDDFIEEFDIEGILLDVKEAEIEMSGYGKLYEDELEKFCLFLAMLDKKCSGVLTCKGEDSDDMWRVVVGKGKVIRERGYVKYDKKTGEEFKDTETKKKVYEITKDKKLLKEIMIDNLK